MTLLTICQDAADTIGIPRPTAVISSPDLQVRRLLAAAQREGLSLQRRFHWQATAREAVWTTTATEDQGLLETIAPGYDGFIDETQWNRTQQQRLFGPLSPQEWQARKASVNVGPSHFLFLRNKRLYVNPVPPAGNPGRSSIGASISAARMLERIRPVGPLTMTSESSTKRS